MKMTNSLTVNNQQNSKQSSLDITIYLHKPNSNTWLEVDKDLCSERTLECIPEL